jgi:hypothetical protein
MLLTRQTGLLLSAETKRRIYCGRWRAPHAVDWSAAFGGDGGAHLPRAVACPSRGGSPSPHTEADAPCKRLGHPSVRRARSLAVSRGVSGGILL